MPTHKERIRDLRDKLLEGLIERDTPMRLALIAALAAAVSQMGVPLVKLVKRFGRARG